MEPKQESLIENLLSKIPDIPKVKEDSKQPITAFWRESEVKGYFSNWWRQPFHETEEGIPYQFQGDDGTLYVNGEQAMMRLKAVLFGDKKMELKILLETDPRKMRELGRKIKNFSDDIWEQYRERIMFAVTYWKYSQNKKLRKLLLKTNDSLMVEASPTDKIWGIGVAENSHAFKNRKWEGLNLLGLSLMRVREILNNN
jgi:ribA/ribD-fused uncharacterized protein